MDLIPPTRAACGLRVERQKPLPLVYRGLILDCVYRLDPVVEEAVVVEAKALDALLPVHHAQLISYLKIARLPLGLLINFHCTTLTKGIRRVINGYAAAPSEAVGFSASSASSVPSVSSVVKGPSS